MTKKELDIFFGGTVVLLGAVAVYFLLDNLARPIIISDLPSRSSASSDLPENHPPIDTASRLAALERLSRDYPQNASYKSQIGDVFYDMGLFQNAIKPYQESLELKPEDPFVETDLATCYHQLGQHDKALEILDKVLAYRPGFPQALYNKGVVLQVGKQNAGAAIEVWEELLRANPNYPMRAEVEQRIRDLNSTAR